MKNCHINEKKPCILLALLLFTSVSMVFSSLFVSADQAASYSCKYADNYLASLVSAEQQNITKHTGNIVLSNDDIMVVKDARLDLNGSLLMSGDSTLILENGILYPDFEKGQHSYTLHDNAKIIMERGSKIVSGIFDFVIYDNSLVSTNNSNLEKALTVKLSNASLNAANSQIRSAEVYGASRLQITNSTAGQLLCHGNARIADSYVQNLVVSQNAYPINIDLVNSTYDQLDTNNLGKAVVHIYWYLTVSVEAQGKPLQGANVQVYYAVNNTLATQQTSSSNGTVKFVLPEREIDEFESVYLGNYTIKVSLDETQMQESIILNSSKQRTISMPTNASGSPPEVIYMILVIVGALALLFALLVIHFSKKRTRMKGHTLP